MKILFLTLIRRFLNPLQFVEVVVLKILFVGVFLLQLHILNIINKKRKGAKKITPLLFFVFRKQNYDNITCLPAAEANSFNLARILECLPYSTKMFTVVTFPVED